MASIDFDLLFREEGNAVMCASWGSRHIAVPIRLQLGDSMVFAAEVLDRPLPKPRRDLLGYASGRVLEALLEALLALSFLDMGYTRNAAGKAFQAWKALVGAILALEKDRLEKLLADREKKWLETKGIPWVPTGSLKPLSQLLEEKTGYKYFSFYTDKALDLHTYQYQGSDPERLLSKHASRKEAATDTLLLLKVLVELVEEKIKPRLQQENLWLPDHDKALQQLKQKLTQRKQQG